MRTKKLRAPAEGVTALLEATRVRDVPRRSPTSVIPLLDCHGLSEVGRRRKGNEDDFLMAALPMGRELLNPDPTGKRLVPSPGQTGFLFLVADGMGGIPCGERASAMAIKSLHRYLKDLALDKESLEVSRTLRQGIRQCQSDLQAEVDRRPECEGMSTTLTGALALARHLYVVHSGDSRCYLLRDSRLHRVTDDHSQAQLDVDAGKASPADARASSDGNHLWNYLTSDYSELRPDVGAIPLEAGDILLLCTDGVSDSVPDHTLQRHLSRRASAENICEGLIAAAREGGRGDDLTAIVLRFGGE